MAPSASDSTVLFSVNRLSSTANATPPTANATPPTADATSPTADATSPTADATPAASATLLVSATTLASTTPLLDTLATIASEASPVELSSSSEGENTFFDASTLSDDENAPPNGAEDGPLNLSAGYQRFSAFFSTPLGKQTAEYRIKRAVEADVTLSWPELLMTCQLDLQSAFVPDMVDAADQEKEQVYIVDSDKAAELEKDVWWNLKGAAWEQFTTAHRLPSFIPPTKMLEHGVPQIRPVNGDIGPRFVKGGKTARQMLRNLSPRDIAYATAGSKVKPELGKVYSFRDVYPLPPPFTFEDACQANGFSPAKTRRLAGQMTSSGLVIRRPSTPLRSLPTSLQSTPVSTSCASQASSSPARDGSTTPTPRGAPTSDDEIVMPRRAPVASSTPTRPVQWRSSSTAVESSPLPPSEFDPSSSEEVYRGRSTTHASNWKTGQRVPGPPGRYLMTRRPREAPAAPAARLHTITNAHGATLTYEFSE
ncbi:hypothetical protein BD626DRAFT_567785 [Schizophyllum amplum]|uniref:Uncharacterized protein n=1 Tax=Schizophyllum amplum TaxID=97359 RepID=A0A550CJG3_9AGAR|nr:hypothetical protein BD626DRAFT_567785 [Auriculariopsis ampla]